MCLCITKFEDVFIFKCCFYPEELIAPDQTCLTRMFPSGTHYSYESIEVMHTKCLAQEHNTAWLRIEPEP